MRVVILDGDVSYPPTSGKRLRTLNLMLQLAGRHRVTYLARSTSRDGQAWAAREYLQDHGIDVRLVDDPLPAKSGLGFCARLAANLASPMPYSVASHQSRKMRDAVNQLAAHEPIDLWQCEWSGYLTTLRDQPIAKRLLVAHNVDSLIWRRYYEVERGALRRWYVRQQWRKFAAFERTVFHQAGRVVAVTEDDARLLKRQFGVEQVDVVDNGIDFQWCASARGDRQPNQYLFLGSLDWRPNQDAVRCLLDDIVPRVNQQLPGARLLIVGRNPPSWLIRRVRQTAQVDLHADVPDVRPYLAESSAMIVPLRIGGGSRLKILEALAAGLPVISTAIGAEGLKLVAGEHYWQADTVDELVAATINCLCQPASANAVAQAGRLVVQLQYDWATLAERLHEIWVSLASPAVPCT
jgi:glycosyltransferase involved in cell wall biosynthesis